MRSWRKYGVARFASTDHGASLQTPGPRTMGRYARVDDGTLVHSLPQSELGFPVIPGVTYTGWYNPVAELDMSVLPNMPIPGESYTILVPKTDSDGNSISGIRTPDVQVPIATYTGWALGRAPFAGTDELRAPGSVL